MRILKTQLVPTSRRRAAIRSKKTSRFSGGNFSAAVQR